MRPQRWLLLFGLGLMAINRVAGLVLPASTKFLVDNIIGKREVHLLVRWRWPSSPRRRFRASPPSR